MMRMERELRLAASDGVKLVKVVHGYGSTGAGGEIRIAVQKELVKLCRQGELKAVIFGEDWRISNETTWALLRQMPELKSDANLGRENKGITVVVMK
jgi:hypothetical protein